MILESLYGDLYAAGIPVNVINLSNGIASVTYGSAATPAQKAQGDSMAAAWSRGTELQLEATRTANAAATESNIRGAFAELRAFRDRTSTTLSTAQSIAILKTLCRVAIWLGRAVLKDHDGTA